MRQPPPLARSILDVIGNTPLMELDRVVRSRGLAGRLLAKLDYLGPGSSKKDRVALEIIRQGSAVGALREGQAVVELTSGNTGTGLAIVCRALGHPFVAVMSRGNSVERVRQMAALGAEVILVDQTPDGMAGRVSGEDLALAEERARQIVIERHAFPAAQFENPANVLAHEQQTGPELWAQARGEVDAFVDCVGTGGTFTGVMRYLRRQDPRVRGYVVEPAGAAVLAGRPVTEPRHQLQGTGYSRGDLALLDRSLVSGYLQVDDEEAIAAARALSSEEGIFAGYSSGANLAAAFKLLKGPEAGRCVAFVVCDSGLKYMSTDLFP